MIYNLFLLLMGGECILFNLPLSAPAYCLVPFRLSKHRLPNSLSQHQANSQAELSKTAREDFKISKRKRTRSLSKYIPMYQFSLACDFRILDHLVTRPVTKRGTQPPLEKLSPPLKKCLGHIVCITIVFIHASDVKFGPPSENSSSLLVSQAGYMSAVDCCLETSLSYATHLSPFTIKFFRFNMRLISKVLLLSYTSTYITTRKYRLFEIKQKSK